MHQATHSASPLRRAGTALLVIAPLLLACSVPVFRYALERWPPDAYEFVVIHDGPLGEKDQALIKWLEKAAESAGPAPSFIVRTIDRSGEVKEHDAKLVEQAPADKLPWLAVLYPISTRNPTPFWAGRLAGKEAKAIVDSPVRHEIAKRISKGESAVWLLLESGDKTKDDAAAKLLAKELKTMEKELRVPELTDDPADRLALDEQTVPLKVAFSIIRFSRTDKAEQLFIQMLLGTEEDLDGFKEPMAFPVFGRGRALWALVGPGINADNIVETCAFLVGPCACQIKAQCPGTDLLLLVDWDELLEGEALSLPELASLPDAPEPVAIADVAPATRLAPMSGDPAGSGGSASGTLLRNVGLAAVLGLVVVGVAAVVMLKGGKG